MESEPAGDYIAIVLELRAASDGTWYVDVQGTYSARAIPLAPLTLVVRLWRMNDTEVLRGSIRLPNSDLWAPVQTNMQIEALIRAWLVHGSS